MKHVVFVNRFFHPDHSATSQMLTDLALHLASRGWEVDVVTSAQRYDDPSQRLRPRDEYRGVRITRVKATHFGRATLPGRALDYLSFYASAYRTLRKRARRGSVVVALTDPPLVSVIATRAARGSGAVLVNWIQDLFPEVAAGLGIRVPFAKSFRDASLRAARINVAIGELMARRVPKPRVRHNWADGALQPLAHDANPLRRDWNLGNAFVVGYSGNLGRAHEFDTILGATKLVPEVRFLVIGGGAQLAEVKKNAPANVEFRPYQPREILSQSLSAADVHLVSLQPQLEGLIVPSKFYGILAVGRPVLFIGARDGELARIIDEHRCGLVVQPGDVDGLAAAIRKLAHNPAEAMQMGKRGRALYESQFAPRIALGDWERILEEAAS